MNICKFLIVLFYTQSFANPHHSMEGQLQTSINPKIINQQCPGQTSTYPDNTQEKFQTDIANIYVFPCLKHGFS